MLGMLIHQKSLGTCSTSCVKPSCTKNYLNANIPNNRLTDGQALLTRGPVCNSCNAMTPVSLNSCLAAGFSQIRITANTSAWNSTHFDIRVSDIEGVPRTTPWKMLRQSRHFKKPSTFHARLTGASHAARKNIVPNMGGFPCSNRFDIIAFATKAVLHSR